MLSSSFSAVIWVVGTTGNFNDVNKLAWLLVFGFGWLSSLSPYVIDGFVSNLVCGAFFWCIIYSPYTTHGCFVMNRLNPSGCF